MVPVCTKHARPLTFMTSKKSVIQTTCTGGLDTHIHFICPQAQDFKSTLYIDLYIVNILGR
jgi:urease alpha subunit